MKKIYLIITVLIYTIAFNSHAQSVDCEPGCIQLDKGTYIDVLCRYNWSGRYINPGADPVLYPGGVVELSINNEPCVFVMVNYTIFSCNGITKIQIDGTVLFDNTEIFDLTYSDPTWTSLSSYNTSFPIVGSPQKISNFTPCTYGNIRQAQIDAINKLVLEKGIPADVEVYFKGSCNSLVEVEWPAGSFIVYTPGGDNPAPGLDTLRLSKSYVSVPCDDACCKVIYEYKIRTTGEGITEFYYQPYFVPANDMCANSPLPNYDAYPDKLGATVYDPVTGLPMTVYGTVVGQQSCELICRRYDAPPPPTGTFTTDVKEVDKKIPLEFSANPTLISSFVKFTTNKSILKVMIFDMTGKKLMSVTLPESNELNTAELKQGTYFIQVYFTDNSVKTVKVVKQ